MSDNLPYSGWSFVSAEESLQNRLFVGLRPHADGEFGDLELVVLQSGHLSIHEVPGVVNLLNGASEVLEPRNLK